MHSESVISYDSVFRTTFALAIYVVLGLLVIAEFPSIMPVCALLGLLFCLFQQKYRITISILMGNIILGVGIALGWFILGRIEVFDKLTCLLLFVLIVKMMILRKYGDYLWIMLVLFFLVAAVAISTVGMEFIPFLVIYLFIQTVLWYHWNRKCLLNRQAVRRSGRDHYVCQELQFLGIISPIETRDFIKQQNVNVNKMLILAVIMCCSLGVLIFFYIPRFSSSNFIPPVRMNPANFSSGTETGFGDTVELSRNGTDISMNMEVVMYVRPTGSPVTRLLRMRAVALEEYENGKWSHLSSYSQENSLPVFNQGTFEKQEFSVIQKPKCGRYLFAPSFATSIIPPRGQSIFYDRNSGIAIFDDDKSQFREQRYRVISSVETLQKRAEFLKNIETLSTQTLRHSGMSRSYLTRCSQFPGNLDFSRWSSTANEWAKNKKNSFEIAEAFERQFSLAYLYSLKTDAVPVNWPNAIEWFMFENKRGHCEYFASAMTLLLRAKGIPARVVNGYVSREWNDSAGVFVIRQSDAHSWVEAYLEDYGWVTFDPTPPDGIAQRPKTNPILSALNSTLDTMRMKWYRNVIDFDVSDQTQWVGKIDNFLGAVIFYPRYLYQTNQFKKWNFGYLPPVMSIIVIVLAIAYLIKKRTVFWKTASKTNTRSGYAHPSLCKNHQFRKMLFLLMRKYHLQRCNKETPLDFALRVDNEFSQEEIKNFVWMTMAYYNGRYGKTPDLTVSRRRRRK